MSLFEVFSLQRVGLSHHCRPLHARQECKYSIVLPCFWKIYNGMDSMRFLSMKYVNSKKKLSQLFALDDNEEILEKGSIYSLTFLFIGVVTGISSFFQKFFAGLAGDSISLRIRKVLFRHILEQDLSFHSEPGNSVGQLTARLTTDATGIQGVCFNILKLWLKHERDY